MNGALVLALLLGGSPRADTCALLTAADIRAVQGEAAEGKSSEQAAGAFRLFQCFYSTPTYSKSVSLALAVADTGAADAPQRYWNGRFHEAGKQEKEESNPPKEVSGVGEEAFWVGSRMSGALYVLQGTRFLRISVGGGESEEVKILRSKDLARRALRRLAGL